MNPFSALFPNVVNMSAIGSIVILFVLLARLVLRKAPKVFSYALWSIVLIRLLVPLSVPSPVSAIPEIQTTNRSELNMVLPEIEFETPADRKQNMENLEQAVEDNTAYVPTKTTVAPVDYLTIGWVTGMVFMSIYSILSYWSIRKKVRISIPLRENIHLADDIGSPFVMGLFRPMIYLPCHLGQREQEYIILHEQHHIRRGDHWIKALSFLALTIHWFNPLVWVAFILSGRDMEMSCDEAVIRKSGESIRSEYAASLLSLATGRRIIAGTPLAFGEGDPKSRIRNLANWHKPAFWVIFVALVLTIVLAVCLLTNPISEEGSSAGITYYYGTVADSAMSVVKEGDRVGRSYITLRFDDGGEKLFWLGQGCKHPEEDILNQYVMVRATIESGTGLDIVTGIQVTEKAFVESLDDAIQRAILAHHVGKYYNAECQTAHFKLLSQTTGDILHASGSSRMETITVYGIVLYQEYNLTDGILEGAAGARIPTVLTFHVNEDSSLSLTEYWEPRDGTYYPTDLKEKFKGQPWPDTTKYLAEQELACYLQAADYFDVGMDTVIHSILTDMVGQGRWHDGFGSLMEGCKEERAMLSALGADTLKYCFAKFLEGGNDALYGQIMAYVCSEIMAEMGEPPLDNWSFQQSGQDWFRAIKYRARELVQSGADLRISHPGTYLLISMDDRVLHDPDWGLTITGENVTPSGMTLVVTQSGGVFSGQLITGQPYFIHRYENGEWVGLEPQLEAWAWTMEAWQIPLNDTVRWDVNWQWLYGELEPGRYRFGKNISCSSAPGVYEEAVYYIEFDIAK